MLTDDRGPGEESPVVRQQRHVLLGWAIGLSGGLYFFFLFTVISIKELVRLRELGSVPSRSFFCKNVTH